MKKTVVLVLACCLLMVTSVFASPLDDAVGYWNFENVAGSIVPDESGNGNDGTANGAGTGTTDPIQGTYGTFDGSSNVNVGEMTSTENVAQLSVSAWVRSNVDRIVSGGADRIIRKAGSGPDTFFVQWSQNENVDGCVIGQGGASCGSTPSLSVAAVDGIPVGAGDQWHHVVMVYDGNSGELKMYVDNVLEATSSSMTALTRDSVHDALIGSTWDGAIDEVAIWDRAITAQDVDDLYNFNFGPVDNTSASVPQNLAGVAVGENGASLTWDASVDPESGVDFYNVYRDSSVVGTSTTTAFVDAGLTQNTAYSYQVSAVNGQGLESFLSTAVVVTTDADLTAPTIVNATGTVFGLSLTLSEAADQATAEDVSNYAIDGGVTVVSATLVTPTQVDLVTTAQNERTVTMVGVEDVNGNPSNDGETYSLLGCFL